MTCWKIEEWPSVSNHAAYIKCGTSMFWVGGWHQTFQMCMLLRIPAWISCSFYCTYHAVKLYVIYCTEKVSKHEVEEKLRQLVSTRFVEICTTDSQEKEDEQTDQPPPSKRLKSESQVCMWRGPLFYTAHFSKMGQLYWKPSPIQNKAWVINQFMGFELMKVFSMKWAVEIHEFGIVANIQLPISLQRIWPNNEQLMIVGVNSM